MEDKRNSFSNVTVRIYDIGFQKDLTKSFKETENQFANSKSAYAVYLMRKGYYGDSTSQSSILELINETKELKASVDSLLACFKAEKLNSKSNLNEFIEIQGLVIDLLKDIALELGLDEDLFKRNRS